MKKLIKSIILIPIIILTLNCCSTTRCLTQKEITLVRYIDSIAWHDSIVFHHIYHEHYKEYTGPKDTLNLETTYSKFKAWNDSTSNSLKGEAINKEDSIPVKIKWKEKIVYKDSVSYIDKPYPVEVPVEVKYVPAFYKFTLGWFILCILYAIIKVGIKVIKHV